MSISRLLVGNLFDTSIFPGHTLAAEEQASGREVERVASYRRSQRDSWTPTTANSETWVGVTCDTVRGASMLIIDREHNLGGVACTLRASFDAFATWTVVASFTVPTASFYGSALPGTVRTNEGACVVEFDAAAGAAWRLYIPAMGAGVVPRISGLALGLAVSPSIGPLLAGADDESGNLSVPNVMTPALWAGTGQVARQRTPELSYYLADETEWADLRWHIDLYHRGFPMWVIPEARHAERAMLSRHPGGSYTVPHGGSRVGRDLVLALVEHQPKPLRNL